MSGKNNKYYIIKESREILFKLKKIIKYTTLDADVSYLSKIYNEF